MVSLKTYMTVVHNLIAIRSINCINFIFCCRSFLHRSFQIYTDRERIFVVEQR